ncbi:hypothetical protein AURDEDRAFT_147591 [Auricularia subglabra TFB-10046 SS5]|nr:hypothetical protein AURDEDRAFT_147591 [Auricularia subglabra TFB-10046 SS5]
MAFLPYAIAALVGLVFLYRLIASALHSYLTKTFTSVGDLPKLGAARQKPKEPGTAVICGGSIAGLLAARVCADHFERVVVVEPEAWTFTPEARAPPNFPTRRVQGASGSYNTFDHKRSRVYQYAGFHAYQVLTTYVLRKLFSGFDDDARKWGLRVGTCDMHAMMGEQFWRFPFKEYRGALPPTICGPRRTLEPLLRDLVHKTCPDIEFVQGTVTGFLLGDDNRVRAVSARTAEGAARDIECAMVVDCTGATQAGLKMLTRAFPSLPADLRENYDPQMNYATMDFPLPPNFNERLSALTLNKDGTGGPAGGQWDPDFNQFLFVLIPNPHRGDRILYIVRQGEGGMVITAGGWGQELPVNLDQLREHVKQIRGGRIPDYVWQVFDMLGPVADQMVVLETRVNSCSRIYYEKVGDILPPNFVAMGDAVMRLNPTFGEGVTKASQGALTLDGHLRTSSPRSPAFGRTFFPKLAKRTQGLWDGAKHTDYGHKTTKTHAREALEQGWIFRWYRRRLAAVLHENEIASSVLWHNFQHLAPPQLMIQPRIVAHVVWRALWDEGFSTWSKGV